MVHRAYGNQATAPGGVLGLPAGPGTEDRNDMVRVDRDGRSHQRADPRAMGRLSHDFGLVIGALIIGGLVTGGVGLLGLTRVDGSFESVVSIDIPRLMTITDLRKQIRMLVVAENHHLLEADPAKARDIVNDIRSGIAATTELFGKYEPYLLPEDAGTWRALRADVDGWIALDAQVLALSDARRGAEATALSKTQSKQWEARIKALIATADSHLKATTARTRGVSKTARFTLTGVFIGSMLLGLIAGLIRRAARAEAEHLQRAEHEHHQLLEQTFEGYF